MPTENGPLVVVATSALGPALDHPSIRDLLVVGCFNNMLEYYQSECRILLPLPSIFRSDSIHELLVAGRAVRNGGLGTVTFVTNDKMMNSWIQFIDSKNSPDLSKLVRGVQHFLGNCDLVCIRSLLNSAMSELPESTCLALGCVECSFCAKVSK